MRLHRPCLCIGVLLALAAAGRAQDIPMGGSETYVSEGPAVVGCGGSAASASYRAQLSIEGPSVPLASSSAHYVALGGPALFGAAPSQAPLVFGVHEGLGTKDGGQAVTLFGRNLAAPGAGPSQAFIGGMPVTGLGVLSDLVATGTTSPGLDGYQNPLGISALSWQNSLGQSQRPGAFGYRPALVQDRLARIGAETVVSMHAGPGEVLMLAYGTPLPGLALPLFNLDGALELILNVNIIVPGVLSPPSGHHQLVATIPSSPALVGSSLPLQGVAISDLTTLAGSFTNLLLLPIQ